MPIYEFRCRTCGATFTESRPMSRSADAATCPAGHDDTRRLLGVAALATSGSTGDAPSGGCCGAGGCCG